MKMKLILLTLIAFASVCSMQAQNGDYPKKEGYIGATICEVVDSNGFTSTFKINKIKHKREGKKKHTEKTFYIDLPLGYHFNSYYFDGNRSYYRFLHGNDNWIVVERLWEKPSSQENFNQECNCEQFKANHNLKKLATTKKLCKSVAKSNFVVSFINFDKIDEIMAQNIVSSIRKRH
jgi:hypothetical protein